MRCCKTPYLVFNYHGGVKMFCPFCTYEDTKVLESRTISEGMRRRRECLRCTNRFTTYEKASFTLMVQKKDSRLQPYDTLKITSSIERSSGKDSLDIPSLTRLVEQKILLKKVSPVKTKDIARIILRELRKVDKMAYLRFATVYKEIEDPNLLSEEIKAIIK
jgi:transcriptional repressor NrdR